MKFKLQRRARSMEQFLELVDRYGCTRVEVAAYRILKGYANSTTVGALGMFHLGVKYVASGTSRRVVFTEKNEVKFGSERGLADAHSRAIDSLRIVLTAKDRVERLTALRPKLKCVIMTPKGPLSQDLQRKLEMDSKEYGAEPYPLVA